MHLTFWLIICLVQILSSVTASNGNKIFSVSEAIQSYGKVPENEVKHIKLNNEDNFIESLQNYKKFKKNKSGNHVKLQTENRFTINVEATESVSVKDGDMQVVIKANYNGAQPLYGKATVALKLDFSDNYYPLLKVKVPVLMKTVHMTKGKAKIHFNVKIYDAYLPDKYNPSYITVVATVEDQLTGWRSKGSDYTILYPYRYAMKCVSYKTCYISKANKEQKVIYQIKHVNGTEVSDTKSTVELIYKEVLHPKKWPAQQSSDDDTLKLSTTVESPITKNLTVSFTGHINETGFVNFKFTLPELPEYDGYLHYYTAELKYLDEKHTQGKIRQYKEPNKFEAPQNEAGAPKQHAISMRKTTIIAPDTTHSKQVYAAQVAVYNTSESSKIKIDGASLTNVNNKRVATNLEHFSPSLVQRGNHFTNKEENFFEDSRSTTKLSNNTSESYMKLQINVEATESVSVKDGDMQVIVTANYNGVQPLYGKATVALKLDFSDNYYPLLKVKVPVLMKTVHMTKGKAKIHFNVKIYDAYLPDKYNPSYITVVATVDDQLTGLRSKGSDYTILYPNRYAMKCVSYKTCFILKANKEQKVIYQIKYVNGTEVSDTKSTVELIYKEVLHPKKWPAQQSSDDDTLKVSTTIEPAIAKNLKISLTGHMNETGFVNFNVSLPDLPKYEGYLHYYTAELKYLDEQSTQAKIRVQNYKEPKHFETPLKSIQFNNIV